MKSTSSLAAPLSDKTLRICATDRVLRSTLLTFRRRDL